MMTTPPSRRTAAVSFYRELVQLGFPRHYPLVQFPNPPLVVALLASAAGWFVTGSAQDYLTAVGTIGIAVWAWQEATDGVNLFRHALGAVVLVSTAISLAHRLA
jgi:hypothetical protein